jgi:hypothetical protein
LAFLHGFALCTSLPRLLRNQQKGNGAYPYHFLHDARVHDFAVDLAKGGKSFGDIKKLVDDVCGDKALKKTQTYKILKQVKMGKNQRGFTKQKTKMTTDLIASVAAAIAEDRRVSI